ncbi:hypothetical Protein YC6258_04347 [Gynuella sunshinyii YC6258]|uniref:Uncharacterized protein n=1 Tax=Gynuella sunshinyii YC6258 TaxID=1445510 RepID=A0A0C5W114_9GAMM|nr:hypothetical Protein YC6258_04347 [Gynuella sunshinyii YC6258]
MLLISDRIRHSIGNVTEYVCTGEWRNTVFRLKAMRNIRKLTIIDTMLTAKWCISGLNVRYEP